MEIKLDYRNLNDHRTMERILELAETVFSGSSAEGVITRGDSIHLVCLLN